MRIAFGTDETLEVTTALRSHLIGAGHVVVVVAEDVVWTDVGRLVAEEVAGGRADVGVACCWTGTGVSIVANKVAGVRAALCTDAETATGARRWNDANVLALGLRLTTPALGREIVDAFLAAQPDPAEKSVIDTID